MSRYRALALRATLVALLATSASVATLTPTAASAAPSGAATATAKSAYPPAKPDLVVNRGSVKAGQSVKATGRRYAKREKVTVTVSFRARGGHKYKVVKRITIRSDKKGKFSLRVRAPKPGTIIIKGKGVKSMKSASATVHVSSKRGHGGWVISPAAFSTSTAGSTAGNTATSVPSGPGGVALAGIGVMALIGSAVVTRRVVRRRRQVGATA